MLGEISYGSSSAKTLARHARHLDSVYAAARSEAPMYRSFAVLILAIHAAGPDASPVGAQVTEDSRVALTNVTLIDGTGAAAQQGMTVLINGNLIEAVFRTGTNALGPEAEVIELTGHFVVPGLVNTHVHLPMLGRMRDSVMTGLERMFYSGVTSLREMAGDARLSGEIVRASLLGEAPLPSIYYAARIAGPTFYAGGGGGAREWLGYEPGMAPWAQAVASHTDVERAVAKAVGTGATGLKLYADLDTVLVRNLIDEAHEQGLKAWAHGTVFPTGPLDAVRSGVDGLSHVCFIFWGLQDRVARTMSERRPFDPAVVDLSADPYQTLFREMVDNGVVLDATARNASLNPGAAAAGCGPELLKRTLRAAHGAGVSISTGTDYWTPTGEPDPTLFTEVEYLVQNGILSPLEAITAATLNGASAIGIEDAYGTVQPGKIADLVILASDPSADIRALQDVRAVVKSGKIYRRQEYVRRRSHR